MSDEQFDAYHELLGIPPQEQPPNHYRLLGISLFESVPEVINNAATQRTNYVREVGGSQYADVAQRLLNEISTARYCLLDSDKKANYDNELKSLLAVDKPSEEDEARPLQYDARNVQSTSWVIGRSSGCDIVLEEPTLSRLHCVLEATDQGLFVTDRNSNNGVFVNKTRVYRRRQIDLTDQITLGQRTVLPWPPEVFGLGKKLTEITVGRDATNDKVIDENTVSSQHLRLIHLEQGIVVQDLGSANGTAYGSVENRVVCAQVSSTGSLYVGTVQVSVRQLLEA